MTVESPAERNFWTILALVAAAFAAVLILAGCATDGVTAKLPVSVPIYCHPKLGPEPAYPDTDAALQSVPDIFEGVKLLLEGRLERIQRDKEKSAALDACAGPASTR